MFRFKNPLNAFRSPFKTKASPDRRTRLSFDGLENRITPDATVWKLVRTEIDPGRIAGTNMGTMGYVQTNVREGHVDQRTVSFDPQFVADFRVAMDTTAAPREIVPGAAFTITTNATASGLGLIDTPYSNLRYSATVWGTMVLYDVNANPRTQNKDVAVSLDHPPHGVDLRHPSEKLIETFTAPALTVSGKTVQTWYLDAVANKLSNKVITRYVYEKGVSTTPPVVPPPAAGGITATLSRDGVMTITGTEAADTILVGQTGGKITIAGVPVKLEASGQYANEVSIGGVGQIKVFGKGGNDTIKLDGGAQFISMRTTIDGGIGNDTITGVQGGPNVVYGGEGNDTIRGGNGADVLYGEAGDDQLFGRDNYDQLLGGAGNDWHDAGSLNESVNFGPEGEKDWNAHTWAVNGASYNDIAQGRIGNCALLAALSSAALRGMDLAGRIKSLGEFNYEVKMFDTAGRPVTQTVRFDGSGNANDPRSVDRGEFWTILYRRAFLKTYGMIDDGLNLGVALTTVTGRASTRVEWSSFLSNDSQFAKIETAIRNRQNVAAGTLSASPTCLKLEGKHAYTVVAVARDQYGKPFSVTVRNPWGFDASPTRESSGNPSDGMIQLTWKEFTDNMNGFYVN